jgi:hypothetical protein
MILAGQRVWMAGRTRDQIVDAFQGIRYGFTAACASQYIHATGREMKESATLSDEADPHPFIGQVVRGR